MQLPNDTRGAHARPSHMMTPGAYGLWCRKATKRRASRRCMTRTRHRVPKIWRKDQRWSYTSRSAQLSVSIVKWLACYERPKWLSKRGSAAKWRWTIDHSALCERRATPSTSSSGSAKYGGPIVVGQRAEGSDEHIGLDHRRARRLRPVLRK